MDRSEQLQEILEMEASSENVYFQPPPKHMMSYPCVVYSIDYDWTIDADNKSYGQMWRYQVIVIDENPRGSLKNKIEALPMCRFQRFYTADNLNHYVFQLFF